MKKKKILIIGGTGFIGYHLAKKAIQKRFEVTSLSTNSPKKLRYLKKVKYLFCDISNKKKLKNKIKEYYDFIINLGGYVDHSKKIRTIRSHYNGAKNLAEIFLNKPPKLFLQIGSCVEYGSQRSPQKENLISNNKKIKSNYGIAKLLASNFLMNLYKKKKFPVSILRIYLAYGPKQDENRLIPITTLSCLKNKEFECSSGEQFRDFIYIDDLVDAIFKLLRSKKSLGQIFNIGSGKPTKVLDVIEKIKHFSNGGKPLYGKVILRPDEIDKLYPDIKKIKKTINWKPKIPLNKGLSRVVKSYKKELSIYTKIKKN